MQPILRIVPHGPYDVSHIDAVEVLSERSRTDHDVVTLDSADGHVLLCRCGRSAAQPVCDGACARCGFAAGGAQRPPETAAEAGVAPRLAIVLDGPLMVAGMTVVHEDGTTTCLENLEAPLCRCGLSADKPWCDHSHRDHLTC